MAIARQTSNTGGAGSGTSLALTKPSSLADADVLVAAVMVRQANTTISGPGGWTRIGEAKHASAAASVAVFYRVVTTASGEGASYTFSWTGGAANGGIIVRYSGVDNTTPSDVAASSNTSGAAGTTLTWTGITTATASAMLISAATSTNGTTTYSAETSPLTEVADLGVNQSGVLCDGEQTSAGASGDKNATLNSSRDWAGVLWALRPASGGTTYTQSVGGTLATAGGPARQDQKPLAGTLASAGAPARLTAKVLAGALATAATLTAIRTVLVSLGGTLASAGTLARQTQKSLAGSLATAGAVTKRLARSLAGTLATAASLTAIRTVLVSLAGTLASAGAATRRTGKSLSGPLATAGSVSRAIGKGVSGTLATAGSPSRLIARRLAGALSTAATLVAEAVAVLTTRPARLTLADAAVCTVTLGDAAVCTITTSDASAT